MKNSAVIFIPPNLSLDGEYAQECIAYVLHRGYRLAAIFRSWDDVDTSLILNTAQVVVVARGEHRGDRPAEVAAPRAERTQVIAYRNSAVGRCSVFRSNRFNEAPVPVPELRRSAIYREGYADGFVDALTLGGQDPSTN